MHFLETTRSCVVINVSFLVHFGADANTGTLGSKEKHLL
jgi:hypothetical protein